MGLLTKLLEPRAATFGPLEDFWYQSVGTTATAGVTVNSQTAMAVSTVYACVRIISQTLAMLPLVVYRRLPDGGKVRADGHPLYDVIHARPNKRQSSFQFREMLMGHALLRGNAYAEIVPGPRGFADQLIPLHPDHVVVRLADDGQIMYEHRPPARPMRILLQDEVFHISTLSDNGIQGLSLIALAKESIGLAVAAQNYGSRFFGEGQRPAGTLTMPGKLSDEGHARLKDNWKETYGGLKGSQNIAILEEGLEWQALGMSNEDAQHLETRIFQVEEIASWFGVPLALLQHTEKTTSWGTGISQLTLGFVLFTMQPWFTRWQQEISQDLILDKDRFFAEFVVEGLMRGDPATRGRFYNIMVTLGVMTRNEVRSIENLNPLPGLDEPLTPKNMQQGQAGGVPGGGGRALTQDLSYDAASRMARKESAALKKMAEKHAGEPDAWALAVSEFYEEYREDLVKVCKLEPDIARAYTKARCRHFLDEGISAVADGAETEKIVELMLEAE